jgi:hypothetical protein
MAVSEAATPALPGATETFGDPAKVVPFGPALADLKRVYDRGIIFLSTATITEENIYMNGLFQNVFVFYRMFEAMGYAPIFLVNEWPTDIQKIPEPMRRCRFIMTENLLRQSIPNVVALLEIGMSMDPLVRQFIKMIGGRLIKVYLGNILNIDIETPIFITHHHFAHHVVGRNDSILVSPHYGQHAEYAACLNHVVPPAAGELSKMIAPYVWDPNVLTRNGSLRLEWRPAARPEDQVLVIMEPNISFQKASFVPLMIAERWYRDQGGATGAWKGKVVVINGDRLGHVPHFKHNVLPLLDLEKDGRIVLEGRNDIVSVLRGWPSATFLLHNYNNEYNYMTMELLWAGFPALHNSPSWAKYGYYYEGADLAAASKQLTAAMGLHGERLETYKGHAHGLAWQHSPYNPDTQAAWEKLLVG